MNMQNEKYKIIELKQQYRMRKMQNEQIFKIGYKVLLYNKTVRRRQSKKLEPYGSYSYTKEEAYILHEKKGTKK